MSRHQARKRFGQNFLIDQDIIGQISSLFARTRITRAGTVEADAGDHNPKHKLIEIGPGRGALTEALLSHGQSLTALELDRDLIPILQTRFSHHKHFHLQQGDALQVDFNELSGDLPLRLVGNLPYNVATPLIFKLLDDVENIVDMHFMLQWEVVARLCAKASDPHYGQLSLVVQNLCETRALFRVPAAAFSPAPKVESGFIAIIPRAKPLVEKSLHVMFNHVVKTAFMHRRKTLRNNLKKLLTEEQIVSAGVDPGARAETIELAAYARLAALADSHS